MTDNDKAPAAAVAEWPDGKELEDGVFMRGAMLVSEIKGRDLSKRYLVASARVQEPAMAAHGTKRLGSPNPVTRNATAATIPHKAPAEPATVNHRITVVKGGHLIRNIIWNNRRSRFLTFHTKLFINSTFVATPQETATS